MPVIDASVYMAMINAHEQEHFNSWAWFETVQIEGGSIVAPAIMLAEVASALSRGVGDKNLAYRAIDQLKGSGIIKLIPVSLPLSERAAAIAADQRVRGCDAVYIALADQLEDSLVTLDNQQLERGNAVIETRKP
jgi:predicted nucleic acid-binding protein